MTRWLVVSVVWGAWMCVASVAAAAPLPDERHPVLLYEDAAAVRDRLGMSPYAPWWDSVDSTAQAALSWNAAGQSEQNKATRCKFLAFAYAMTEDARYGDKALEILLQINPQGNWGDEEQFWAGPLMAYAQAYDMLKGAGHPGLDASADAAIRAGIAAKTGELREVASSALFDLWIPMNNWRIRMYCALDIAAMALADHGSADDWHDKSEDLVEETMDFQLASIDEGGFAEGPYYLEYSADICYPHMVAYQRVMREPPPWAGQLEVLHDWSIHIRLPDGLRPNIDDAHLTRFYGWYWGPDHPRAAVYRWDDGDPQSPANPNIHRTDALIDKICQYDASVVPQPPDWGPTVFLPEAGEAVLRSDWGPDGVYMLLMGEHGDARNNGLGHEHPDATSFMVYAYGEMLALDSGHISWEQHELVNNARNHSLILVDGKGPPVEKIIVLGQTVILNVGVDAYLKDYYDTEGLDFCADSTTYWWVNVDIVRSVWFVDNRYFVVMDEVSGDATHTYEWLLHGNGGGTTGGTFERSEGSATWGQGDAELTAYVPFPQGVTLSDGTEKHSFQYNQVLEHEYLKAAVTAKNTRYVSVLYPRRVSAPSPVVEALDVPEADAVRVEDEAGTTVAYVQPGGSAVYIPSEVSGVPDVRSNAKRALAHLADGRLASFALHNATWFGYNDLLRMEASKRVSLALNVVGDAWRGHVAGGDSYTLELYTGVAPSAVTFGGAAVEHAFENGKVTLALGGEGDLVLTFPVAGENAAPVILSTPPDSVAEGEAFTYDVEALDLNFDDVLTYRLEEGPQGMTIEESTGAMRWVPGRLDAGRHTVTVAVRDPLESAYQTWTLAVRGTLIGDFDGNDVVGLSDFVLFVDAYGEEVGSAEWDPLFDLDGDERIGLGDFVMFVNNYGNTVGAAKPVGGPTEPGAGMTFVWVQTAEGSGVRVDLEGAAEPRAYGVEIGYDADRLTFDRMEGSGLCFEHEGKLVVATTDVGQGRGPLLIFERKADAGDAALTVEGLTGVVLDREGGLSALAPARTEAPGPPAGFALYGNTPNPFNPQTRIAYQVGAPGEPIAVTLRIYDVSGQLVRRLVEGDVAGGAGSARWDGRDDAGRLVSSGVYVVHLKAGAYRASRKMVVVR